MLLLSVCCSFGCCYCLFVGLLGVAIVSNKRLDVVIVCLFVVLFVCYCFLEGGGGNMYICLLTLACLLIF